MSELLQLPAIFDAKNPASPVSVSAAQTALLLMDYHNLFTWMDPEQAVAAMKKANRVREWALAHGALVVHCLLDMKQSMLPSYKSATQLKGMFAVIEAQPTAADEHPDLAFSTASGDLEHSVTHRPGFISVLKSESLRPLLSNRGIKSLILCGITTSGCVLSTARAAGDEEYIVTVIEDACLDLVPGLHDTLIQKVLPSQAHVATAATFLEQWDKAKDGV